MTNNCHLSCIILDDSGLNGCENFPRRPWNAVLVSRILNGWDIYLAYLACSFAKPLWTSIKGLTSGKRVGSNDSKSTSASVASASLQRHRIKCQSFVEATMQGSHSHSRSIGSLMSDDDTCLRWREANIPFIANGRSESSVMATERFKLCNTYRIAQTHRRLLMLLGGNPCFQRSVLLFTWYK